MSCNLIRLARRGAVFAIAALLIGCDETTMPATMPDTPVAVAADNTANATADTTADTAVADTLHSTQQTTGGAVDGSQLAKALSICLDNIPDMGRTRQAMQLSGFRFESSSRGQDLYSAAGRSVFAVISVGADRPRCAIGRDGLRGEAAVEFAEQALRQAYGPAIIPIPSENFDEPVRAGWIVERPTGILAIAVTPPIDLQPYFLGSFIAVTTDVEVTDEK